MIVCHVFLDRDPELDHSVVLPFIDREEMQLSQFFLIRRLCERPFCQFRATPSVTETMGLYPCKRNRAMPPHTGNPGFRNRRSRRQPFPVEPIRTFDALHSLGNEQMVLRESLRSLYF